MSKTARAWLLTINNPSQYYKWAYLPVNPNIDNYIEVCKQCNSVFANKKNSTTNGCISVFEIGKEGTPHIHMYVCSKYALRFSTLKNMYPTAHIDKAFGSWEENKNYLFKLGKHSCKKYTQKCSPVSWGNIKIDNKNKNLHSSFAEQIKDMCIEGMTLSEIFDEYPKTNMKAREVQTIYYNYHLKKLNKYKPVYVEWRWGMSGTGKTYIYKKMLDEGMGDFVFKTTISKKNKYPFDDYDFAQHNVVFIDELRADGSFDIAYFLPLLDNYVAPLAARYNDKVKNYDKIIITSILNPKEFWNKLNYVSGNILDSEIEDVWQFYRRIDSVIYHYIDEAYDEDDSRKYKEVVWGKEKINKNVNWDDMKKESDKYVSGIN